MRDLLLKRVLPQLDHVGTALAYVAMVQIVVLISLMLYEVVSRRVFNAPTMWAGDLTYMSNGTLFLIGAAYTLRRNAHIRIDFLGGRQGPGSDDGLENLLHVGEIDDPVLVHIAEECNGNRRGHK